MRKPSKFQKVVALKIQDAKEFPDRMLAGMLKDLVAGTGHLNAAMCLAVQAELKRRHDIWELGCLSDVRPEYKRPRRGA